MMTYPDAGKGSAPVKQEMMQHMHQGGNAFLEIKLEIRSYS